ncbi:MAG: amidase [Rhodospirillaceae bacterium]|nr:amidase [Rhodospirillaceae bacterium]MDD9915465.1 amidase [Rhodospirillaceae bacterium]MDD9927996.1 amidase [Rhodospirillaceae bacterium]
MTGQLQQSIRSLAAALRDGTTTSVALAEEAIANHARFGTALDAYKCRQDDRFLAEARAADAAFAAGLDFGPLQGIPVSVKDLYGVAGYETFAGSPAALPEKWEQEGPVVGALRAALAPVAGKTHTVEFAFGGVGSNAHWGTPRNPWDAAAHRVPGGSSAGAGVSLCEGSALLALGSDTAGSVRVPASFTGNVGVKTSFGRWSLDGIVPLSPSLDTAGVLARTVPDAVLAFAAIDPLTDIPGEALLAALSELTAGDVHIGVCDHFFEGCDPGVAEGVQAALDELAAAGAQISKFDLPEAAAADEIFMRGGLAAPEFAAFITGEMAQSKSTLDPNVAARFESMEAITAVDYLLRRARLAELAASADDRMADVDVVVGPTVTITPPTVEAVSDGEGYRTNNMAALRNTRTGNMLALSAVTIPVALDKAGMPVGLQIMAPLDEDERALAVALAFEAVLGDRVQRLGTPPMCQG